MVLMMGSFPRGRQTCAGHHLPGLPAIAAALETA
jgi:hypothetical protein